MSMLSAMGRRKWVATGPAYDELGRNMKIENATKILETSARTVIIGRLNDSIAVAFSKDKNKPGPFRKLVKINPVISFANDSLHILSTGLVPDNHQIFYSCREFMANYTRDFGKIPSATQLARHVSFQIFKTNMFMSPPLISHLFIFSTEKDFKIIYEILPNGEVNEVIAGIAGMDSQYGRKLLEESFRTNCSLAEIETLFTRIFEHQIRTQTSDEQTDEDANQQLLSRRLEPSEVRQKYTLLLFPDQ
jgi:20S proteasome alpha/beta subunit